MPASRARRARHGDPWVSHDVRDLDDRALARRAERELEQPLGDARVRAGEAPARSRLEPRSSCRAR